MVNIFEIGIATKDDLDGVLDLQERNLPDQGGKLSVRFPRSWFDAAIGAMPVIVARRGRRVIGYLVSSPLTAHAGVPVVEAMLHAYRGSPGAYVYGPICVDEAERGQGVAAEMLAELRVRLPGREGVLFIRNDNEASVRAHSRMGMKQITRFAHEGTEYEVLSYWG